MTFVFIIFYHMGKYTEQQIVSTLMLLKTYNYSFKKTSEKTGIARATIKKWHEQSGSIVSNQTNIIEAVAEVVSSSSLTKEEFINDTIRVKTKILRRVEALIPDMVKPVHFDSLINGLKVIHGLENDIKTIEESAGQATVNNFVSIIMNQNNNNTINK